LVALSSRHLGVQRVEPLRPQASIPGEPLIDLCKRFGPQSVDPPLCLLPNFDQPGFPQHTQVPRYTWPGDWQ
jgi:hypothetical protein